MIVGRNDPCPCGSGKKFKKCCLGKESSKFGRGFLLDPGGRRLAFLRPSKPEIAMALADKALEKNDKTLIDHLPEDEAGPYTFAGWVSADGKHCLDDDGKIVGEPQRGDSIVSWEEGAIVSAEDKTP